MRSKLKAQVAISLRTVDELIQRYVELSAVVQPRMLPRTAPDPDDDVVIATAIAAGADLLVTGDKDLLSVGHYEGGRIVSVREAMKVVVESA
jgi:putative PIN family toxin of toxin-antitoxin system